MEKNVKMPKLRPEMERGVLCAWLKEEGDTVTVTLQAECEEEIGERVPILTEP
mgnify:CR=1 FL=1